MEHQFIATNDIVLHVVQAGPADGPLVILLHGFPEFWYGWQHQIPHLAAAGFRVWAPDMRGYNLSDKPRGAAAYNLDLLAADVAGLIDAAGVEKAYLVGHDWGGVVAWHVAALYPERLEKLVILNAPHGRPMAEALRKNRPQRRKSWYIFAFQLPWLPERMLKRNNWAAAVASFKRVLTPEDVQRYRDAWSQPRAVTGMIHYYRALFRHPPASLPRENRRIRVPTQIIWGARDRFLGRELAEESIKMCDQGRLHFIEEATHWVQHEAAAEVNAQITAFFAA